MWLAALSLYRARQNAPAAPHQRCRHQPGADCKLGERHPDCPDPLLMVRSPSEGRVTTKVTSPPVSLLGLGRFAGQSGVVRQWAARRRRQDPPADLTTPTNPPKAQP